MVNLAEAIKLELDLMQETLGKLPAPGEMGNLSDLELAGTAAMLHNLYAGMENAIRRIALAQGLDAPDGPTWHRDLLDLALNRGIISADTWDGASKLLSFRHFFRHSYAVNLSADRLRPLVETAQPVCVSFASDVTPHM